MRSLPIKFYLLAVIQVIAIFYLGYGVKQGDFYPIIFAYSLGFGAYLLTIQLATTKEIINLFIGLAILLRLGLIFSFPNLSDDIYRFIWDGQLIINGQNPFDYLPSELITADHKIPGISRELYEQLNSPEYYTIYPPIAQLVNVIAVALSPSNWWGSAVVMKCFLFGFEIGSILLIRKLLEHFQMDPGNVLYYALNPLIVIEVVGNLHFEGGMIFFFLLGFYLLVKQKWDWAAVAMAGAVAAKLLPLLFMPFLIKRLGWLKSLRFFTIMGLVLLVLFLPLINGAFLQNFGDSLNLYFRRFEFNASIYYIFRWIGYQTVGHNLIKVIGPRLAFVVLVVVVLAGLLENAKQWKSYPLMCLLAISTYLFMGTTIHPWYVSLPLVMCLFTPYRFPVLWSGVIMLTYINYSYSDYYENLWIVGLEYLLVFGFLLFEVWKKRRPSKVWISRRSIMNWVQILWQRLASKDSA